MRRKLSAICLIAAWLAAAGAWGQQPKVVLVGQLLGVAVDRSLGWKASPDAGLANADLLNASLTNSAQRYAVYFPGQRWNVQETLVNTFTGRRWCGNGLARLDGGSGFGVNNGPVSQVVWNKNQLDFDGTTVNATATGDSGVITVSGHTPDLGEKYWTLTIDDTSAGFIPGLYEVVDVSGQTYTLDRDCTSEPADNGTQLVGTLQATLLRDESYGAVYDGLTLKGSPNYLGGIGNPANRCAVGHHAMVDLGAATPNTSKAHLENYSIADCDVAILCGHGLAKFGEASDNFFGADWNNADHVTLAKGLLQSCDYGFVVRTTQGLSYTVTDLHTSQVHTLFYIERGGKFTARGIWTMSNQPGNGGGPVLLRIGGSGDGVAQTATVSSPIVIDGGTFDAPSEDLKLLEMDGTRSGSGQITIANFTINRPFKRVAATGAAGTAQSGTMSTILLAAAENQADGYYAGGQIRLTGGTGAGQVRKITGYTGATDTATISPNWTTTPDSTTTYEITTEGTAQGGSASTIVLDAATSQGSDFFNAKAIRITSGKGAGQVRTVQDYDGASDTVTVNLPWKTVPNSTSSYEIFSSVLGDYYDVDGPVVTVKDGWKVTLENVAPIHPGWIRLVDDGGSFKPSITLLNCVLIGTEGDNDDVIADPSVVIDKVGSDEGLEVRFEGCRYGGFSSKFCRNGIYRTDEGWITEDDLLLKAKLEDFQQRIEALENP